MDTLTVLEKTLLNIRHIISKYNTELDDGRSLLTIETRTRIIKNCITLERKHNGTNHNLYT